VFACAARRYWLSIFPCAREELKAWRRSAEQIPDSVLREAALDAILIKRDILEGAVAFAVLAPPTTQRVVVRAITAFELAFDYLDTLMEMPSPDPIANTYRLGQALLSVFQPDVAHLSYYEHHPYGDDAGYLVRLVDICRAAIEELPSYAVIADAASRALAQIVKYQSLNHWSSCGSDDAFAAWAGAQSAPELGLHWWETAAAVGSQLVVLALIASAADPTTRPERVAAIEQAYFPWIGALSTLLDSVVDRQADQTENQQSLVDHYRSPQIAAQRMRMITLKSVYAISELPDADHHLLILAAMAAFFHATPQAANPDVRMVTRAVFEAMGTRALPAFLLLRARRAWTLKSPPYSNTRYSTDALGWAHNR
jgi:tetraprenyl-beta-curcumene synthase